MHSKHSFEILGLIIKLIQSVNDLLLSKCDSVSLHRIIIITLKASAAVTTMSKAKTLTRNIIKLKYENNR